MSKPLRLGHEAKHGMTKAIAAGNFTSKPVSRCS
jgi:hypothetical protein